MGFLPLVVAVVAVGLVKRRTSGQLLGGPVVVVKLLVTEQALQERPDKVIAAGQVELVGVKIRLVLAVAAEVQADQGATVVRGRLLEVPVAQVETIL
jgi:hypothetical protein